MYDPVSDLYKILDIRTDATSDEIHRAYRVQARLVHTDHNPGDPCADGKARLINAAGEILREPTARRAYDQARTTWLTRSVVARHLVQQPIFAYDHIWLRVNVREAR
jgi:curved DNA-binding protein CbpA